MPRAEAIALMFLLAASESFAQDRVKNIGILTLDRSSSDFAAFEEQTARAQERAGATTAAGAADPSAPTDPDMFMTELRIRLDQARPARARAPASPTSGAVPGGFFAAIDIAALPAQAFSGARPASRAATADAAARVVDNTVFGAETEGYFSTDYEDINAVLLCEWTFNEETDALYAGDDALWREEQLEKQFRTDHFGADAKAVNPPAGSADSAEPTAPQTDETEGLSGLERTISLAGIPCTVSYRCDDVTVPCRQDIFDALVENIKIVRPGDL
ncbi:hypothetical protein [Mesorhizobium muleiense]|uniref:hypothetical protein n=1 Tax=Mesorhizobium muleiense TaxID=1004279 RepID=UPI001F3E647D|nr:hypothetical protein [Mesorhizobium muleiense]MCF6112220.1 hypothetical protein [Mesorhizobium muleiense]